MTDDYNFQRYPAYNNGENDPVDPLAPPQFRKTPLTYVTLFILLILWPALSFTFSEDPTESLKILAEDPIFMIYLPTMAIQWIAFLLILITVRTERTGLSGLGFTPLRFVYFLWAVAFLLVSAVILAAVSLILSAFGLGVRAEIGLMLPDTTAERIMWVLLSFTVAICEETAFRGYLMTRLRILGTSNSWISPVLISSVVFGAGHTYQGAGGFILISAYGVLFALLYIRTGSIWPGIIAHFFQDVYAMFFPFQGTG